MAFTIKSATYGGPRGASAPVDVTAQVRKLSTKHGLQIARVSNAGLGLGPVLPGIRKRLTVVYHDGTQDKTVSALERKSLRIGKGK